MKINSEKKGAIEWTSRPGSELVEFAVSPKDSGNVAIEVDFSKTIEITGFQVSSSIKSFQISYKKDVVGSAFIPYVSDVTGDPYTFNVNRNGKVFLPDMDSVLARWLKISPVRLGSDSVQDVVFDVLGCCKECPFVKSTIQPSTETISSTETETSSTQTPKKLTTSPPPSEKSTPSTPVASSGATKETTGPSLQTTTSPKYQTSSPSCDQPVMPTSCSTNGINEPYDIDLGKEKTISGYKIAGNEGSNVETFQIAYKSNKNNQFERYSDPLNGSPYQLQGNSANVEEFSLPGLHITARYIRITPKQFASNLRKGFCIELLGCETTILSTTEAPEVSVTTNMLSTTEATVSGSPSVTSSTPRLPSESPETSITTTTTSATVSPSKKVSTGPPQPSVTTPEKTTSTTSTTSETVSPSKTSVSTGPPQPSVTTREKTTTTTTTTSETVSPSKTTVSTGPPQPSITTTEKIPTTSLQTSVGTTEISSTSKTSVVPTASTEGPTKTTASSALTSKQTGTPSFSISESYSTSVPSIKTTTSPKYHTTTPSCDHPVMPISCSTNGPNQPYIIDLGEEKSISGYKIATNAGSNMELFELSYKLSENTPFQDYSDPNTGLSYSLQGNSAHQNKVFFLPGSHVSARYIRITPKKFASESKKGFCIELQGCETTVMSTTGIPETTVSGSSTVTPEITVISSQTPKVISTSSSKTVSPSEAPPGPTSTGPSQTSAATTKKYPSTTGKTTVVSPSISSETRITPKPTTVEVTGTTAPTVSKIYSTTSPNTEQPSTTAATPSKYSTTPSPTTQTQVCKQSCCIAQADLKIVSSGGGNIPFTINRKTGHLTFIPDENIKMVDINLQKRTKISGLYLKGIKTFELFTKKVGKNSKFIPVRSEVSGKPIVFSGDDGSVYFPNNKIVSLKRIQLRNIVTGSKVNVNIDILGCCSQCPPITTAPPTFSPTTTLPPSKKINKVKKVKCSCLKSKISSGGVTSSLNLEKKYTDIQAIH